MEKNYGIQIVTEPIFVLNVLLTMVICYMLDCESIKGNLVVNGLLVIGTFMWGIAGTTVNTYSAVRVYMAGNLHHTSAYLDSIYNVMRGMPYCGNLTEQYGHYGLFFWIFRYIGINTKTIGIIMGGLSAIVFLLCMISFCNIVKSNIIRILVIISASLLHISYMAEMVYWQTFPHRLIFPAITIFLVTQCAKKGLNIKRYVVVNIIMMLAVLWNLESGMVCVLAWCSYVALDYIHQQNIILWKNMIKMICVLIGAILFDFFGAMLIVNIYNALCGGKMLSVIKFIGVILDQSYMDFLVTPLFWGDYIYVHKMMFFLACIAVVLIRMQSCETVEQYKKISVVATISVLGTGMMTYFINRPAAGERIIDLFAILLFGFFGENARKSYTICCKSKRVSIYKICRSSIGIYAIMLLLVCVGTGGKCGYRMYEKIKNDAYNYQEFQKFTLNIKKKIPKDTWAKGEGTTAIYMELGWDKQTRDFDDFTSSDRVSIKKQKGILVAHKYYSEVPKQYQLLYEFVYHGIIYGYYKKV